MAVKKSELYSSLWKSCDELRGGMDASQYKDYILILLFVKYVSDKYAGQIRQVIKIPEGGSFEDMVKLKSKPEIGDGINKIIGILAEANSLKGVIDVADFNEPDKLGSGKDMVDRLTNLIAIFQNEALNFRQNNADGDDLLGDAYEYLMRHFATESGKSKGQFYTPAEVSQIMAKVIGISHVTQRSQTIYDPTCGSGSLLLKAAGETATGVTIYGQEMDNMTSALARMNMILHNNPGADIRQGNSLSNPLFTQFDGSLKTFDYVVANPPFSNKAWTIGFDPAHDLYGRFQDGVPPMKNGDYAFLLHILKSLKCTGQGAVILPHGVLFRGNAEADIRTKLIMKGYIKGIIGLPANLFYGTGIPACIIVLDKENAGTREGIFMIDASKDFMKDGNKNRLRHQDIHKIVDVFTRQLELPKYSRMVSTKEIKDNGFNLNIPRYIDSSEPEDLHDIAAHLLGGIPDHDIDALQKYWDIFPTMQHEIVAKDMRLGYSQLCVNAAQIRPAILNHPEFAAYTRTIQDLFAQWETANRPMMQALDSASHPKQVIATLAEHLLAAFAEAKLIDAYDIYQHLMTYWTETMQDDVYLIVADGWKASTELIPPALITSRYFAQEQQAIEQLEIAKDDITHQLEEMVEEHSGEGGLLEEAKNDKGKITSTSIKDRLKDDIFDDPDAAEEHQLLTSYLSLLDQEAEAGKKVRDAQKDLDARVAAKYKTLSVDEVQSLVIDDKWLPTLAADVQSELHRISQSLTGRIKDLAERYATPLPQLTADVDALSAKVDAHLERMGFAW